MKCPFCHKDNDRVVETRTSDDGFLVRRRRVCQSCNRRFTTYERIEVGNLRVIKRDGARVPFDRDKIREGVERACWKRPVREAQGAVSPETTNQASCDRTCRRRGVGEAAPYDRFICSGR